MVWHGVGLSIKSSAQGFYLNAALQQVLYFPSRYRENHFDRLPGLTQSGAVQPKASLSVMICWLFVCNSHFTTRVNICWINFQLFPVPLTFLLALPWQQESILRTLFARGRIHVALLRVVVLLGFIGVGGTSRSNVGAFLGDMATNGMTSP